jgi:hypothetical protein
MQNERSENKRYGTRTSLKTIAENKTDINRDKVSKKRLSIFVGKPKEV